MTAHESLEDYRNAALAVRAALDKVHAILPPSVEPLSGDPDSGVDRQAFAEADTELQKAEAQLDAARRNLDS